MNVDHRSTEVFLQFEKGRYTNDMRLVNATSKKPTKPKPGAVVVKLDVRIPRSAFEPLTPEAIVVVEEAISRQVVQVVAQDPGVQYTEHEGEAT